MAETPVTIETMAKKGAGGIPNNPKVRAARAPIMLGRDIHVTAIGGSRHPSASGHDKLANTLDVTFPAI